VGSRAKTSAAIIGDWQRIGNSETADVFAGLKSVNI
jgi:hypothetical protein